MKEIRKVRKVGNSIVLSFHSKFGLYPGDHVWIERVNNKIIISRVDNERSTKPKDNKSNEGNRIATNKNCSLYLGCFVAEKILAKMFSNVKVMPPFNPGYDFICGKGLKIDVKSAATGDKSNNWSFIINRNTIPDYFLCIAFDNREDLNPVHLWLIPGKDVNHLTGIQISKTMLHKWDKYEQDIRDAVLCCDEMKNESP